MARDPVFGEGHVHLSRIISILRLCRWQVSMQTNAYDRPSGYGNIRVQGFPGERLCKDEISEFMFTLPRAEVRPAGAPVPEPNPELGTIVVKFWETRKQPNQVVVDPAAARGGARVKPATKAALAKGGKATTATASGNQVQAINGRAYTADIYDHVGTHPVATCRYNYATRSQLQMRGIINPEIVVPVPKDEDVEVVEAAPTGRAKRRKKEEEFKVDKDGVISFD